MIIHENNDKARANLTAPIGRWEDDLGNKGYYDVPRYHAAKTEYNQWRKFAHGEQALTLHFKVEAGKKVMLLESRSYEIVIED